MKSTYEGGFTDRVEFFILDIREGLLRHQGVHMSCALFGGLGYVQKDLEQGMGKW
jgi:hypothetical protein